MALITHDHDSIARDYTEAPYLGKVDCPITHTNSPGNQASITRVKVDGVTVWEKPKPKNRVHRSSNPRLTFWKEDGEADLFVDEHRVVYAFDATYE